MGAIFYGFSALSGFAEWMAHPIIKMTQSFIGRSALNVGRWTLGVGRWALDVGRWTFKILPSVKTLKIIFTDGHATH